MSLSKTSEIPLYNFIESTITRHDDTNEQLSFRILFAKGDDQLSRIDIPRIRFVADYMKNNPALDVGLDGYADGNSSDEYANLLSWERTMAVERSLVSLGISHSRITSRFHGNSSVMINGENLGNERGVYIHLSGPIGKPRI